MLTKKLIYMHKGAVTLAKYLQNFTGKKKKKQHHLSVGRYDHLEHNAKSAWGNLLPSLEIRNRQIPKLTGHWQLIRQAWVLYIDAHPSHEAAETDKPINSFLLAELLDFYFSLVSEQQKCLMFPKQLLSETKQGGYRLNSKD